VAALRPLKHQVAGSMLSFVDLWVESLKQDALLSIAIIAVGVHISVYTEILVTAYSSVPSFTDQTQQSLTRSSQGFGNTLFDFHKNRTGSGNHGMI